MFFHTHHSPAEALIPFLASIVLATVSGRSCTNGTEPFALLETLCCYLQGAA